VTQRRLRVPPVGGADLGDLRRTAPISRAFGFERGQPIDRYYLERFLALHAQDIHGRVLEVGDDGYTRRYGGDRVVRSDILSLTPDNPNATIVGDLARAGSLPTDTFDCLIVTQTLQFVFNAQAAVATLHRALKPGGVLLASIPGISQVCRYDMDRWGDYWRFTDAAVRRLLTDEFGPGRVDVQAQGNVLAALGFLHGIGAAELTAAELDTVDADYQLLITAYARRSGADQ